MNVCKDVVKRKKEKMPGFLTPANLKGKSIIVKVVCKNFTKCVHSSVFL